MNKTKEIIKSDGSLKQKIKELIKQVIDEITTSAAAGSGEGSAGVPRVPNWVSKSKKGRADLGTVLGYTLAKPVNEAADPTEQPSQQGNQGQGQQEPEATAEQYPAEDNTQEADSTESLTPMLDKEVEKYSSGLNKR